MKKILLLVLIPVSLFAQKKDYYYDQDWTQISKSDYFEKSRPSNLKMRFENDTSFVNKIELIKEYGKLHIDSLTKLRGYLKKINGKDLVEDSMIVIDYYPGADPCNSGGARTKAEFRYYYKRYLKKLNKIGNIDQFFIYESSDGIDRFSSEFAVWKEDLERRIQQTFFRLHYPCNSFVVIDNDGKYIIRKGEHHKDQIYDTIKELKENN